MFFFQRIWHLKKQQSNVRMHHKTFGVLENPLTSRRKFTYWNNNNTKMNWRWNIFNFLKLRKSKKNLCFSETLYFNQSSINLIYLKQAFNLFMIYTFSYYIDHIHWWYQQINQKGKPFITPENLDELGWIHPLIGITIGIYYILIRSFLYQILIIEKGWLLYNNICVIKLD